jgi:serine/threonine-protein kinase
MSQAKRIGRYTVIRQLPPGGMAEVFVARRDDLPVDVVLKQMRAGVGDNKVVAHRFIREAQVASLLDHPHIAKVYEASVEEGALCMAVEYVRGFDLSAIMYELSKRRTRIPAGIGLGIVTRVLSGLDHAHSFTDERGRPLEIVHRDAGPRNVMIGFEGEVKIIDFGLAKAGFGHMLTASGVLLGTPRYMAPEQARGEVVDARADVYAAGVTLYELLTGRALVTDTEPIAALRTVLEVEPRPLSELEPTLPKGLTPVLARALEKDRDRRYPTASALRADILDAAKRIPIATDREIAEFMQGHFPDRERIVSQLEAMARRMTAADTSAGSSGETVVVDPDGPTEDTPLRADADATPTADEVPVRHQKIDLAIPGPRVRVRIVRQDLWKVLAYVLAVVAIVMVGIVAYRFAAGI